MLKKTPKVDSGMHYGTRIHGTDMENGIVYIHPRSSKYSENYDKIKWIKEDDSDGKSGSPR